MRFSTTDGRVWDVPDMCSYCQLDTAGNHQPHCPLSQSTWHMTVIDGSTKNE